MLKTYQVQSRITRGENIYIFHLLRVTVSFMHDLWVHGISVSI